MLSLVSKVSGLGNSGEALEIRGILGGLSDMRNESEGEITRGRRQDVRGKSFVCQGFILLPGQWAFPIRTGVSSRDLGPSSIPAMQTTART